MDKSNYMGDLVLHDVCKANFVEEFNGDITLRVYTKVGYVDVQLFKAPSYQKLFLGAVGSMEDL